MALWRHFNVEAMCLTSYFTTRDVTPVEQNAIVHDNSDRSLLSPQAPLLQSPNVVNQWISKDLSCDALIRCIHHFKSDLINNMDHLLSFQEFGKFQNLYWLQYQKLQWNFIMFKLSAVSQIWKKYIQKLNEWDLSLTVLLNLGYHLKYLANYIWFAKFNENRMGYNNQ